MMMNFWINEKKNFVEEAREVYQAQTREALLEELADIFEVIASFCEVHQVSMQDIIDKQNQKRLHHGGFKERKFVTVAEHLENSFGERYCLADPEKYPEIIE